MWVCWAVVDEQFTWNFRFCLDMYLSSSRNHFPNKKLVIQAFRLDSYVTDKLLTFLKHLGFTNLPMTKGLSFSMPVMFAVSATVSLSLLFLPP